MLTFAQPLFLYALAGLAVPIIAHLINRERARALKFPSIRFISQARLPQEGRRSIKDLLLLLLRCLCYAAVIGALAGPQWQPEVAPSATAQTEAPKEDVIFIVDASASMSGWGAWERALQQFNEKMDTLNSDSQVGIVIYANQILQTFAPSPDRQAAKDWLFSEQPTATEGRPSKAISQALSLFQSENAKRLILISDFQSSDWQSPYWPQVPEEVTLEFLSVADFSAGNLSLVSAQTYPASEERIRVVARVKNNTATEQTAEVTLTTTNEPEQQTVKLAPGQTQPVSFLIDTPDNLGGQLSLSEDAYPLDNDFVLWLGPPPPTRILTMLPVVEEPDRMTEMKFARKALNVTTESSLDYYQLAAASSSTPFSALGITPENDSEPTEAQTNDLFTQRFGKTVVADPDMIHAKRPNAVYLLGSGGYLESTQWPLLKSYLNSGGIVLSTPSKSSAKQFRALRENDITNTAYLGHQGRHDERRTLFHIGWLNPESSLAETFDEESREDLFLTDIYQYIRLRADENAEILLKTEKGDPLLIREQIGKGQLITSAWGWDTQWSDFPLRNSFLPLLRELLADAIPAHGGIIKLNCGDTIPETLLPDPEGFSSTDLTNRPNIIELLDIPVEINVSRKESITESTVLSDIRAQLLNTEKAKNTSTQAATTNQASITQIWPWLALFALACIAFEMLFAGWLDGRNLTPKKTVA